MKDVLLCAAFVGLLWLPLGSLVLRLPAQGRQAVGDPLDHLLGSEGIGTRGGQLEGQRYALELAAKRYHRLDVVGRQAKGGVAGLSALDE